MKAFNKKKSTKSTGKSSPVDNKPRMSANNMLLFNKKMLRYTGKLGYKLTKRTAATPGKGKSYWKK